MNTLRLFRYGCAAILFLFYKENFMFDFLFFFNTFLIGIGLAMDAFSVSLANGLNEPNMSTKKALGAAGVFGIFQGVIPLIGWLLNPLYLLPLLLFMSTFQTFTEYLLLPGTVPS